MKQPDLYKLEGVKREVGHKSADELRGGKQVPAVLYGPKVKENIHFSVNELDLEKILSVSQTKLQELTIDGKAYQTLLKNVEFDPVTDRPLHADFYLLDPGRPVKLRVPVVLAGIAKGVRDAGGRVFQPLRIVRIKVIPEKIPAQFELDITSLGIGDSLHISDLELDGIEPLDDPARTIVTIAPPKSESAFTSSLEDDEDLDAEVDEEVDEAAEENAEEETTE